MESIASWEKWSPILKRWRYDTVCSASHPGLPLHLILGCLCLQEQLIRHAGAQRVRGVEGSGVEGRGGRRRSRSINGPGSPRFGSSVSPATVSSSQQGGSATGKRKRSLSVAASSMGAGESDSNERSERSTEMQEESAERERENEEARDAAVSVARPAIVYFRLIDALQRSLKSGDMSHSVSSGGALASSGAGQGGTLELFLSGGDDFLQGAGRDAHEAYEASICPVGRGGGVDENIAAMDLRATFIGAAGAAGPDGEGTRGAAVTRGGDVRADRSLAAACRTRVLDLLCEGELFAVASSRPS